MSATAIESSSTRTPLFERILCMTGLTREGAESVRQAATLAGPAATIDLVTVAPRRPPGMPHPQAEQIESLVIGDRLASERSVECRPHIAEAADEPTGVLDSVTSHDLVVVPDSISGLEVLQRAPASVLIARAPSAPTPFPESILIAVDGTAEAHAAARLGAELSLRYAAPVSLVATPEHDSGHQDALERDIEVVAQITGKRPIVLDEYRGPVPSILAAAAGVEASLIVMGRRPGDHDPSVSAHVAGASPCSVLVVRDRRAFSPRS
jgi:nucleotide-binding universal stress UspA family protein